MISKSGGLDVFVSYAADDREAVRELVEALNRTRIHGRRMRVFMDERSIDDHESITGRIRAGVPESAALLAYYSRAFSSRPACQLELTYAFLLAQRSGTVEGRILVINPEDGVEHIEPVELRDLKYRTAPGTDPERRRLAEDIARQVAELPGPLGAGSVPAPVRWWPGEPLPARGIVHRYARLWRLHSALHAGRFSLVERAPALGVAVVSGLPGSGKTTLVEQYAREYEAAFPGGVYRFTLTGDPARGTDPLVDYRRLLREMATATGISIEGAGDDHLVFRIADHLTRAARPVLWIVDQVPVGTTDGDVRRLLLTSRHVHTVLTTRENRYADIGVPVPLTGLTEDEGLRLLEGAYAPGQEADAVALVRDLGGHPQDLRIAAARLRETRGLVTLAGYRERMARQTVTVLGETLAGLDAPAVSVLGLASVLAPAPIPRALLGRAAELRHGWSRRETSDRLVPVLESLGRACLVTPLGEAVNVHSRVLRALPPGASEGCLQAAGTALAERLTGPPDGTAPTGDEAHARHLVTNDEPADDLAVALLHRLIEIDTRTGNHLSAGRLGSRLVTRLLRQYGHRDARTREAAAAATLALVTVAGYEEAIPLARLALSDDPLDAIGARVLPALAAALDGTGRFTEAEPYWERVEAALSGLSGQSGPSGVPADHAAAVRVDRVRALRQRGRLKDAARALALVPASGLPHRHLEEALLHLLSGRPGAARDAARRALAEFERAGLARHPAAFEAASALVDAELALFMRKPYPFGRTDREQLPKMERLCAEYRQRLGPANPLTLGARVGHGIHLARWGDPEAARAALLATEEDARSALDERHPVRLRIRYALSVAELLMKNFPAAAAEAGHAYREQRRVLGESHPDTLFSLLQLGVAGLCLGEDPEAGEKIARARSGLREVLGPWHDEVWRAYISQAFASVPHPLLGALMRMSDLAQEAITRTGRLIDRVTGRG